MKQTASKLHAMFLQSVIPIFDSFNTFLKAEETLIYIFYHYTSRLCSSLLSRFVLFEVISVSDDVLKYWSRGPWCLEGFLQCIYWSNDQAACKGQWHHWKLWVQLTFIFLPERHQTTLDKLDVLMERFPKVINDMNSLGNRIYRVSSYCRWWISTLFWQEW